MPVLSGRRQPVTVSSADAALFVQKAGDTMTGGLNINPNGLTSIFSITTALLRIYGLSGAGATAIVFGEGGGTGYHAHRYSANPSQPTLTLVKGRGAIGAPLPPVNGDVYGTINFGGISSNGNSAILAATFSALLVDSNVSDTARASRLTWGVAAQGAVSPSEVARLEYETGLSMYGENPVIDGERLFRMRSYTLAGAPTSMGAGRLAYFSDVASGAPGWTNGSSWQFPVNRGGDVMGGPLEARTLKSTIAGASGVGTQSTQVQSAHIWVRPESADASAIVMIEAEGTAAPNLYLRLFRDSASEPQILQQHARGTRDAPAALIANDRIGRFNWMGFDGHLFKDAVQVRGTVHQPTISSGNMGAAFQIFTIPFSSMTITEVGRFEATSGWRALGQLVFDANAHFVPRQYTHETQPTSLIPGRTVFISNPGGGAGGNLVTMSASGFLKTTNQGGLSYITNANCTALSQFREGQTCVVSMTLTSSMNIFLCASLAVQGSHWRITRKGLGAFDLNVFDEASSLSICTMSGANAHWADFHYHPTAGWMLTARGSL